MPISARWGTETGQVRELHKTTSERDSPALRSRGCGIGTWTVPDGAAFGDWLGCAPASYVCIVYLGRRPKVAMGRRRGLAGRGLRHGVRR